MRTFLLVALVLVFSCLPVQAQKNLQSKLLPGYYIFIGRQPGSSAPRYVFVGDNGSVRWDNGVPVSQSSRDSSARPDGPTFTPPPLKSETSQKGEYDTYEYPFIKWKPKILATGALVQLETTMESGYHSRGNIKYKVNVLVRGSAIMPAQGLHVDLLDKRGFSLCSFSIGARDFGLIAGTSVMEAHGTTYVTEEDYQKAVDYTVK
jgi:hypothetical protein